MTEAYRHPVITISRPTRKMFGKLWKYNYLYIIEYPNENERKHGPCHLRADLIY